MKETSGVKSKSPEEIEIPVWFGQGSGMLKRRSAVPPSHPESEWNYVLKNYPGVDPKDYGIESPLPKCPTCKQELHDDTY